MGTHEQPSHPIWPAIINRFDGPRVEVIWLGDQTTSWLPLGSIYPWASRLVIRALRTARNQLEPVMLERFLVAIRTAQQVLHGNGEMEIQDSDESSSSED